MERMKMILAGSHRLFVLALMLWAAGPVGACAADAAAATPEVLAEGRKQYMLICIACHQPTGMGLPPVFPPLTKSEYVNGGAERLIAMVLKGNAGPMTIDGKPYNNIMHLKGEKATVWRFLYFTAFFVTGLFLLTYFHWADPIWGTTLNRH